MVQHQVITFFSTQTTFVGFTARKGLKPARKYLRELLTCLQAVQGLSWRTRHPLVSSRDEDWARRHEERADKTATAISETTVWWAMNLLSWAFMNVLKASKYYSKNSIIYSKVISIIKIIGMIYYQYNGCVEQHPYHDWTCHLLTW